MDNQISWELAKATEFNAKAEAQAIYDYSEMMKYIDQAPVLPDEKDEMKLVIAEIISDELNHQEKLRQLYVKLTAISPNKD
mgnify:CR=1 FL=1